MNLTVTDNTEAPMTLEQLTNFVLQHKQDLSSTNTTLKLAFTKMNASILDTPKSIYESTILDFPAARLRVNAKTTEEVSIKITLNSTLPEIHLQSAISKDAFELRLKTIKLLQIAKRPLESSVFDCNNFSIAQPLTEWQQFNRFVYEKEGGVYVDLIINYLNNASPEAEQKLFDLGLAPSQVCRDKEPLSDGDLAYFQCILDKDLNFKSKINDKFPGLFKQIQTKVVRGYLKNKPSSDYDRILELLQTRVLGQEMATTRVATALSSQENGREENYKFLFVGPTGTGKTELAKAIGSKKAFISFKMNQYANEHDISRFFGSPIGYLGSDSKPDLARELDQCVPVESGYSNGKRIFTIENAVILFDELEKSHSKTRQSLLTLFDEGIVDISYTTRSKSSSENLKIQYQIKKSVIIATCNLFQQEICNSFQQNKTAREISEKFTQLNALNFSQNNFSPEFLGRLTITPFGPIPRGPVYQSILKEKMIVFLKEFKEEFKCHAAEIEEGGEKLFYNGFEDLLYGNGTDIRKVQNFFNTIKQIVNQNRDKYGDISDKKFIFFCKNDTLWIKLAILSYGEYEEIPMKPIPIQ